MPDIFKITECCQRLCNPDIYLKLGKEMKGMVIFDLIECPICHINIDHEVKINYGSMKVECDAMYNWINMPCNHRISKKDLSENCYKIAAKFVVWCKKCNKLIILEVK